MVLFNNLWTIKYQTSRVSVLMVHSLFSNYLTAPVQLATTLTHSSRVVKIPEATKLNGKLRSSLSIIFI